MSIEIVKDYVYLNIVRWFCIEIFIKLTKESRKCKQIYCLHGSHISISSIIS